MKDNTELEELTRMCCNVSDLAYREVASQIEEIGDEGERRTIWHNAHDTMVARPLVEHAAEMYTCLKEINNPLVPAEHSVGLIRELLEKARPDQQAMPHWYRGQCGKCDAELTEQSMLSLKCENCGKKFGDLR